MSSAVREAIGVLTNQSELLSDQTEAAFDEILKGESEPVLIAGFLTALRMKGETVDDITAGAKIMRRHARRIDAPDDIVDTCGTGGLDWTTLNTSTASAIVVAAAGGRVAKHGNRSVPPKTGSADVLEALGVNLTPTPQQFAKCLTEARVAFMFAQAHHSAMKHVAPVRKTLGIRTIFNLLGPLTNPAGAKRQVLGVFAKEWVEPLAQVLKRLGVERAYVVHGNDNMDEITVTDTTTAAYVTTDGVSMLELDPVTMGVGRHAKEELAGGSVDHNANAIRKLLNGDQTAFRDIVCVNAGAALHVSDKASSIAEGVKLAQSALDSGRAKTVLEKLVQHSNAD